MRASLTLRPGIELGPYPERAPTARHDLLDRAAVRLVGKAMPRWRASAKRQARFLDRVEALEPALRGLSPLALRAVTKDLRSALAGRTADEEMMAKAFALIREVSTQVLNMRHYRGQLAGGWIIANGMLAEMHTGEGKTLTATLPAAFAALAGVPVIYGPHMNNFEEEAHLLTGSGGIQIDHPGELSATLKDLLNDNEERIRLGKLAKEIVEENRGALTANVDMIQKILRNAEGELC